MATSSAGQGDPASLCRVTEHMSPANDVAVPGQRLAIGGQANSSQVTKPGHIDVSTPNVARMYDWFLGGKDNYAADREAGAKVLTRYPGARLAARANRAFLRWAVRHLAGSRGIRQFLDVGTGLPTQQNVHEVAQRIIPGARTVYVDNDPVVLTHARALLSTDPRTIVIRADVREPVRLIDQVMESGHLDFRQPVALLLVAVMHFVRDDERPAEAVRTLVNELAPGSMLVLSHLLGDVQRREVMAAAQVYQEANVPAIGRTRAEIKWMFDGTHLVEPGLRPVGDWLMITGAVEQLEPSPDHDRTSLLRVPVLCGMGRKG